MCGGDTKLQIQNSSSTRVYPIIPGGGTPIMILRQYVYVASINAPFASSIPNKITPFRYSTNLSTKTPSGRISKNENRNKILYFDIQIFPSFSFVDG